MPESNIDRVRRGYEAYNATGRIPFEMLDPEIELRLPAIEGGVRVYTGHEGVADGLGEMLDFFRDMRFEVEEYLERGDRVAVILRMAGHGAASGATVEGFALHEWKIRGGVALEWHIIDWFTTKEPAVETMRRRDAVQATTSVSLVQQVFDAWNDGKLDDVLPYIAEDIEWLETTGRPEMEGAELRGRELIRSGLEELFETWQEYRLEPKEMRELEDGRVLAIVREVARGRASGATVASDWGYLITIDQGRLTRVVAYRDPATAIEEAGSAGKAR